MKTFKLNNLYLEEAKKRTYIFLFTFFGIIVLVGVIHMFISKDLSLVSDYGFIAITYIFIALIIYKSVMKNHKRMLEQFEVIIDDDCIYRKQPNFNDLGIRFDEIEKIEVISGNVYPSLNVRSHRKYLSIPHTIENYDEIRETLLAIEGVQVKSKKVNLFLVILFLILGITILIMGIWFNISNNMYVITVTGILLLIFSIWSLYDLYKNYSSLDNNAKIIGLLPIGILIMILKKVLTII